MIRAEGAMLDDFQAELHRAGIDGSVGDLLQERIFESGCRRLNLLSDGEEFVGASCLQPWFRGGSESYVCAGEVVYLRGGTERRRRVVAKAYAGFGLGVDPVSRVASWWHRAEQLELSGPVIPKLYAAANGLLFEEFIEWTFIEFVRTAPHSNEWMISGLRVIVEAMEYLRLSPVAILSDLRTDGERILVVDFGEDLGSFPGPVDAGPRGGARALLCKELRLVGLERIAKELD